MAHPNAPPLKKLIFTCVRIELRLGHQEITDPPVAQRRVPLTQLLKDEYQGIQDEDMTYFHMGLDVFKQYLNFSNYPQFSWGDNDELGYYLGPPAPGLQRQYLPIPYHNEALFQIAISDMYLAMNPGIESDVVILLWHPRRPTIGGVSIPPRPRTVMEEPGRPDLLLDIVASRPIIPPNPMGGSRPYDGNKGGGGGAGYMAG